jgi:hypothetical protein
MCIFWPVNLVEMIYLIVCQLGYLAKFDKNIDNFDQNGQ